MSDEAAVEKEIQEKGKTAPRITPDMIDAEIAGYVTARASDIFKDVPGSQALQCLTICIITTKNGFTLLGKSACASPENFDHEIGHKIAYQDARNQLWALEGYQLRTRLTEGVSASPDVVANLPGVDAVTTDGTDYKALYETTREVSSENYASLQGAMAEIERLRGLLDSGAAPVIQNATPEPAPAPTAEPCVEPEPAAQVPVEVENTTGAA